MSYAFPPEIQQLVDGNLASGVYASEDEVLRAALRALNEYHATIADVLQGQEDHRQGLGLPLKETFADIRRQLKSAP